ncbi:hypothetical protein [Lactiplantibacillus paraxiangfangensis]|uniref:hypothetical protein n=1 Tax=Lactiplantibacillus paraxiangfangensis TaxID=3076224 RepID=UPI0030C74CE3
MQTTGTQAISPHLTIDWDQQTFTVNNGTHLKTYQFVQLKDSHVIQVRDTKQKQNLLTRTLVGSFIAGSVGALAGALGADQQYTVCRELTLHLTLTNDKTYDFKLIMAPTKTSTTAYRKKIIATRDMSQAFQRIVDLNRA